MNSTHSGQASDAIEQGAVETPALEQAALPIEQLSELTERCRFLLSQAEDVARELAKVVRVANEVAKRIENLAVPRITTTPAQVREDSRPTALAQGPQTVLRCITDGASTIPQIAKLSMFSKSTVRTYLPILRRAGLLHPSELKTL